MMISKALKGMILLGHRNSSLKYKAAFLYYFAQRW